MFVLRPSSPIGTARLARPAARAVEAKTAESKEPFIDEGLPIPQSYEIDLIRAMLQDPFRIFIYWEVRQESLKALTRFFSAEDAASFRVVLKLVEIEGRHEAFFEVERKGRYWMMVFPDRDYQFEIGVRSPRHGYIALARSNRVHAPRGTVSPLPAPEPEYRVTPSELSRIMEASGFGADRSLDITIAAASTSVGEELIEKAFQRLPHPVRSLLARAASGQPLTAEMIEQLPEPLRSELMKLLEGSGPVIASAGLAHYLPEMLREVIEDEGELIEDHLHPLHIAPRYFAGGSEQSGRPAEKRRARLPQRPGSWIHRGQREVEKN